MDPHLFEGQGLGLWVLFYSCKTCIRQSLGPTANKSNAMKDVPIYEPMVKGTSHFLLLSAGNLEN